MSGKVRSRLRVLCVALCLMAMAGLVQANDGGRPRDPRFQIEVTLENPKGFHPSKENNPSGSALLEATPSQFGDVKSDWLNWVGDHLKGLGLGILVGAGVALGII